MKQTISQKDFEKKVEIESANLQHFEHQTKTQADKNALDYINSKYQIS